MMRKRPRRGRPAKDPRDRREKVVAVRFTAEEWRGLRFEISYAAKRGVRVAPSDLVRKAVKFYVDRQDLKRDYT